MIDWYLEGIEFGNCNCDWCFPFESEPRPNRGCCRGFEVTRIDRGHFGGIDLGGFNVALFYAWPGPMFEGGGEILAVIDQRANGAQRRALATILHGGETEEAKTHWWVLHAMSALVHAPVFRAIEFTADVEAGTARVVIPGILDAIGRPVGNRAHQSEHRLRIDAPKEIAFELAGTGGEAGRLSSPIDIDLHGTYGQFNILRHSGSGVVHRA